MECVKPEIAGERLILFMAAGFACMFVALYALEQVGRYLLLHFLHRKSVVTLRMPGQIWLGLSALGALFIGALLLGGSGSEMWARIQ